MRVVRLTMLAAAAAVATSACDRGCAGGPEGQAGGAGAASVANADPAAQGRRAPPGSAERGPGNGGAQRLDAGPGPKLAAIGVKVCDDYLAAYQRCVMSKVPEAQREVMAQSLLTMHAAWTRASAADGGRQTLVQACRTAVRTARRTLASFDCEW